MPLPSWISPRSKEGMSPSLRSVGEFAESDILTSKEIFRKQLVANVPLAVTIYQTLAEKSNRRMKADFFIDILDELYPSEEALRQFDTVVDWGRYAELFEYDASERQLYLPTNGIEASQG